jgi:choline dehydrogenase-like flavoprotein
VTAQDKAALSRVMPPLYNLMYAAGAKIIIASQEQMKIQHLDNNLAVSNPHLTGSELEAVMLKDSQYQSFLKNTVDMGISESNTGVFSAHQMGSCRMAKDPSLGPVNPQGEVWECSGLYVSDGSLFPTSLGINPMITIAALARHVSRQVMKAANVKPGTSAVDF